MRKKKLANGQFACIHQNVVIAKGSVKNIARESPHIVIIENARDVYEKNEVRKGNMRFGYIHLLRNYIF